MIQNNEGNTRLQVTASVYMPSQGKLACGRDNGSIILVSAAHVVVQHLLDCVGQDTGTKHCVNGQSSMWAHLLFQ